MQIAAQFALATLLPVLACILLTLIRRRTRVSQMPAMGWQVVVGVVFGLIAIYGTEAGIPVNGAMMNVRDAAPLAAGLFFGGPAGIIAGVIGGVERWIAVMWGVGDFTRVACTLGTMFAGVYAALLRKYLFDDRMPSWVMALAAGVVAEVVHLLLVFLTNFDQASRAFQVVQACALPMISCVAISAGLSALAIALINRRHIFVPQEKRGVAQIVQSRLLVAVVAAFFVTVGFTALLQTNLSRSDTASLLQLNIQDVEQDIVDASDANLLSRTQRVAKELPSAKSATSEECARLAKELDVAEVDVIGADGVIAASSVPAFVGFDMASGEQSAAFLVLLPGGGQTQLVQSYQPMAYDPDTWRKYAGVSVKDGFVQVGYDSRNFHDDLSAQVETSVKNRHVGQSGTLAVIDDSGAVISSRDDAGAGADGSSAVGGSAAAGATDASTSEAKTSQLAADAEGTAAGELFTTSVSGEECYAVYQEVEGYRIIALLPVEEADFSRDVAVLIVSFLEVLVFAILFAVMYLAIKRVVVRSIWQVNGRLGQITSGNLDVEVDVRDSAEFSSLSDDINQTVDALKRAIAAEAARIDRELAYAHAIQEGALPRTFPPFPQISKFDLYASMKAAREVGGDFYDFFLIGERELGFVVADVSGKGIPAALFMMSAKTELGNAMRSGKPLAEAVTDANLHLCLGNDSDMFVTAWIGVLDYESGQLTFVCAGHNPPLLRHEGSWEWLRARGGVALGIYEKVKYRAVERTLEVGDALLLYTDGVTEAMDVDENLYGEDRLEALLQAHDQERSRALVNAIREDLAKWAEGAEQSDDITVLCLEYGIAPETDLAPGGD